jgi:hypothetical protein
VSAGLKRAELRWNHPRPERSANLRLPRLLARVFRAQRGADRLPTPVEEL